MDVILQLDPSSLALWFAPPNLGINNELSGRLKTLTMLAMTGRHSEAEDMVNELPHGVARNLGIEYLSNVWHEQRHFVDHLLTNYGCLLTRQYTQAHASLGRLLHQAELENRSLTFPLSIYGDPIEWRALGIAEPWEELRKVGKVLGNYRRAFMDETQSLPLNFGNFGLGGHAQTEAVAFLHQQAAVDRCFSRQDARNLTQEATDPKAIETMYLWIAHVAQGFKATSQFVDHYGESVVDGTPLTPLIYGALAIRVHAQEDSTELAARRLLKLLAYFESSGGLKDRNLDTKAVWQRVNEACETLWGRTALDEMSVDYELEARFVDRLATSHGEDAPTTRFVRDLHDTRGRLLELLRTDPELVLWPPRFHDLLTKIHVPAIIAQPSGNIFQPPEGWGVVHGESASKWLAPGEPGPTGYGGWWWSAAAYWPRDVQSEQVIGLRDQYAWEYAVKWLVPAAKLAMSGRRSHVLVGAEWALAEEALRKQGVQIEIAPAYARPRDRTEIHTFWHYYLEPTAICDGCGAFIERPGGTVVSPWAIRYIPALSEWARDTYGRDVDGRLTYVRDWSDWVVCEGCSVKIERLRRGG